MALVNVQSVLYLCAKFYNFLPYSSMGYYRLKSRGRGWGRRLMDTIGAYTPLIIVIVVVEVVGNYTILFCAAILKWHLTKVL